MKCEFCGTELIEGDKVCGACGAPVKTEEQAMGEQIFNDPVVPAGEEVNVAVVDSSEVKEETPVVPEGPVVETPVTNNTPVNTPVAEAPKKKGLAIASLIIGILCLLGGGLTIILPIIGLILGICNKDKCGQKTAGIIMNVVALVFGIIIVVFFGLFAAVFVSTVNNMSEEELEHIETQIEELVNGPINLDGDWVVEGESTEGWKFENGTFYWYKDINNKDDYYWSGTYTVQAFADAKTIENELSYGEMILMHPENKLTEEETYYLEFVPTKAVVDGQDATATAITEGLVWKYLWSHLKTYDTDTKTFYYVYNLDDETMNYEISRYAPYNY